MFAEHDKHYPSRSGQTSLATAVTNITKPVTREFISGPVFAVVMAFRSSSSPGLDDNQPHRRPAEGGRPPTPLRRRAPHAPRPRGHQQQGQQQVRRQRMQKRRVGFGRLFDIEFILIRPGIHSETIKSKVGGFYSQERRYYLRHPKPSLSRRGFHAT